MGLGKAIASISIFASLALANQADYSQDYGRVLNAYKNYSTLIKKASMMSFLNSQAAIKCQAILWRLESATLIYLKNIKDNIAIAIANHQSPQEVLCKFVLWQYSEIEFALKNKMNKVCSMENFLSVYLKIGIAELEKLLDKLKDYKDKTGKDLICLCVNHK